MKGNKHWIKPILFILAIVIIFLIVRSQIDFARIADIQYLTTTIQSFGIWGPIVFILTMAIAIIISPIPSLPLDIVAGAVWGPFLGGIYAIIGAEIGAIIAFLIARKFGRIVIQKILKKNIIFCDGCSHKTLFGVIAIARLFPVFQFDIISYGAGLTKMSTKSFAIATLIGMIPATFAFTYFGGSIMNISSIYPIIFSIILIILIFLVPFIIKKYNFLGLNKYYKEE